jgi:hypothetical protein
VRSTNREFLDRLSGFLRPYVVEGEAEWHLFSADCGVEKVMAGNKRTRAILHLYQGTLLVYQGRSHDEMAGRLIGLVRDLMLLERHEFVHFRAGTVAIDGAALMLPSPPQEHLPALVGSLLRHGSTYLGDEAVLIDPVLYRAYPVGLPLLVDATDMPIFPDVDRRAPRDPRRERAGHRTPGAMTVRLPVPVDELGSSIASPAPVRWIVFPEFDPDAPTELQPIDAARAIFRFAESGLNLHIWGDRALVLARRLLEGAEVRRLVVGSIEEGADVISRFATEKGGG